MRSAECGVRSQPDQRLAGRAEGSLVSGLWSLVHPALRISHSARSSGFSLIEVVIAIGILSIGLVGAIRVFPVGLRASQRASLISRGTLAVQRTLEATKLKSWDELAPGDSVTQEDQFEIAVSIDQPKVEGLVDPKRLKRVSVTVTWMQEGRPRSLSAVTLFHRQDQQS